MMSSKIWGMALVMALSLCCLQGISLAGDSASSDNQPFHSKVFQGKLYYLLTHPVATPFAGEIVEKKVKVGQFVQKGDVMLKVTMREKDLYELEKRTDVELQLLRAEMEITTLKRQLSQLQKKRADARELFEEGMGAARTTKDIESEIEYVTVKIQHAEKELSATRENVRKERALISSLLGQKVGRKIPRYALIHAPISGHVVWEGVNVRVGSMAAGKLFDIGVMDPMIIRTQMYESDTAHIKPGDEADVILEFGAEKIMKARVKSISWLPVDRNIDTPSYYMVDLEIPNPGNVLKEGYKVRVMFPNK